MNRRQILSGVAALLAPTSLPQSIASEKSASGNKAVLYGSNTLAEGIRSRQIATRTGVNLHILEAGHLRRRRRCVVLLHGFPELAYSWRNQLLPLAQAGFHVVAPDLRGYGRSATRAVAYGDDLLPIPCSTA